MADNDRDHADQRRMSEGSRERTDTAAERDRADREDADERRRSLAGLAADEGHRPADLDHPTAVAAAPVEPSTAEVPATPSYVAQPTTEVPATTAYAPQQAVIPTAAPQVVHEDTVTERGFSPGQVLVALAGVAFLALGITAVARTGLQGSLSEPIEPVLGWDHTALLGLYEIGVGAVMVLGSLRAGARWLGGLAGIAAIVGGVLIVGELDYAVDELGTERDFGWVPIVLGAVALLGAAIPRIRRTRRITTTRSVA